MIFFFILLLTACGSEHDNHSLTIEPKLQSLVDQFMFDCNRFNYKHLCEQRLANINSIVYGNPGENNWGFCTGTEVIIKENLSAKATKLMVYHELGHCILHLQHDQTNFIMNTRHNLANNWDANWEEHVKNLFRALAKEQTQYLFR